MSSVDGPNRPRPPQHVVGWVVGGRGIGRTLGFPTANLTARPEALPYGIYAAWVVRSSEPTQRYGAVAYWGERPVFDDVEPSFELYLTEFDGDLVGEQLTVELVKQLRGDQRFPSVEALVSQMHRDVAAARHLLVNRAA